jgi:hypothetical protein
LIPLLQNIVVSSERLRLQSGLSGETDRSVEEVKLQLVEAIAIFRSQLFIRAGAAIHY